MRIKRLIKEKPKKLRSLESLSKDLKNLFFQSTDSLQNVFLQDNIKTLIDGLIIEWNNRETFEAHHIPVRNKILLHGATGNGKTTIARHMASLMSMPFIEIKADLVINSKLGETGANIHNIFNQLAEPCILFWDEIDTIGKRRGMNNANSADTENDRMVNSVLVNLEKMNKNVIFIGATNRYECLDSAFLRRFDTTVDLPNPNIDQRVLFIKQLIQHHNIEDPQTIATLGILSLTEQSYAAIKNSVIDSIRKQIINHIKSKV